METDHGVRVAGPDEHIVASADPGLRNGDRAPQHDKLRRLHALLPWIVILLCVLAVLAGTRYQIGECDARHGCLVLDRWTGEVRFNRTVTDW